MENFLDLLYEYERVTLLWFMCWTSRLTTLPCIGNCSFLISITNSSKIKEQQWEVSKLQNINLQKKRKTTLKYCTLRGMTDLILTAEYIIVFWLIWQQTLEKRLLIFFLSLSIYYFHFLVKLGLYFRPVSKFYAENRKKQTNLLFSTFSVSKFNMRWYIGNS